MKHPMNALPFIEAAAADHGVTELQILSPRGNPKVCAARKQAMRAFYKAGNTQAQVAVAFGRNVSTVCYALSAIPRSGR